MTGGGIVGGVDQDRHPGIVAQAEGEGDSGHHLHHHARTVDRPDQSAGRVVRHTARTAPGGRGLHRAGRFMGQSCGRDAQGARTQGGADAAVDLAGEEFGEFIAQETEQQGQILRDAGLVD